MLRVLLVDDEPFIVQGLTVLIDWNEEGYEIAGTAANGEEALEFLKENEIDIIIADIKMPVMTGLELLETLREEKISDAYFIILSGYSDFNYAQQAIRYKCMDYMLKPVQREELIGVLRKAAHMHENAEIQQKQKKKMEKEYLSRNVISLIFGKYDQINLNYVKNHMRLSSGVRYIHLELDDIEQMTEMIDEEKRTWQRILYENCLEFLGEDGDHCIFDPSGHGKGYDIGFLYCDYMADEQGISEQRYLEELLKAIRATMAMPVVMLAGKRVEDISNVSKSYGSACVLRSFQAFRTKKEIYYYEREVQVNQTDILLCKQSIDTLVRAIEQNRKTEVFQGADHLFEEMNQMGMAKDSINLNINYLLFQLIHLAVEQDSHVNQEEIMKFISENTFENGIMRGGKVHLRRFAGEYAEYLAQLRKNVSRGVLLEVEKEVCEHYAENLTLRGLGKKYYVNSAYLGQLFRKKYEQSFKDYLNNYRMEKAAEKLLRTDEKIYQIAEEVGCHDLDYFISRFIAAKGCTPAKFRKQSRES